MDGNLFKTVKGLLLQHDSTAEVISSLAKAAHVVLDHSDKDGFVGFFNGRLTPCRPTTEMELTRHIWRHSARTGKNGLLNLRFDRNFADIGTS